MSITQNVHVTVKQQTRLSNHGRTVVPAPIRKRYGMKEGDRLVWIDDGRTIKVFLVPDDPIRALRGRGRGQNLVTALLKDRREVRERES